MYFILGIIVGLILRYSYQEWYKSKMDEIKDARTYASYLETEMNSLLKKRAEKMAQERFNELMIHMGKK